MAFDGNGNWISDFSAVADRDANIKILASRFDNIFIADIATSFENCLTKDGQVKTQTNFNANNYRVINVADPVNDKDAVNKETLESHTLENIFKVLYPVGSIYIGTQSTCPLESLISGSTWTKVQGRYLLASGTLTGTSESYSATNTVPAGLPNHSHKVHYKTGSGGEQSGSCWKGDTQVDSGLASASNAIYGASNTVRPPAYVVNVWRRTA